MAAPKGVTNRHKIDPDRIARILQAVELGLSEKGAATAAGISPRTLRNWKRLGRAAREKELAGEKLTKDETVLASLAGQFGAALERLKIRCLANITKAGTNQWQANAWILERRFPEEFALRQRLEHTGADGKPIETKSTVTLDDIDKVMSAVRKNNGDTDPEHESGAPSQAAPE